MFKNCNEGTCKFPKIDRKDACSIEIIIDHWEILTDLTSGWIQHSSTFHGDANRIKRVQHYSKHIKAVPRQMKRDKLAQQVRCELLEFAVLARMDRSRGKKVLRHDLFVELHRTTFIRPQVTTPWSGVLSHRRSSM